jgi:hypothetical protein
MIYRQGAKNAKYFLFEFNRPFLDDLGVLAVQEDLIRCFPD